MCFTGRGATGAYGDSRAVRNLLGSFWASVQTQAPSPEEQSAILAKLHPDLPAVVRAASLAILSLCQKLGGGESASPDSGGVFPGWHLAVDNAQAMATLKAGALAQHFGRYFSLRDVLKLCKRLQVGPPSFCKWLFISAATDS